MKSRFRLIRLALTAVTCVGCFVAGWSAHQFRLPAPVFCDDVTCALLADRLTAVADQIADAAGKPRYLAIGDSLTQGTQLPVLCGRIGINAGITGATTVTFLERARGLAKSARPDFVFVGLGTNDALREGLDGYGERIQTIARSLSDYPVILIPISEGSSVPDHAAFNATLGTLPGRKAQAVPPGHTVADGVHFNPDGTVLWIRSLTQASAELLGPQDCSVPKEDARSSSQ